VWVSARAGVASHDRPVAGRKLGRLFSIIRRRSRRTGIGRESDSTSTPHSPHQPALGPRHRLDSSASTDRMSQRDALSRIESFACWFMRLSCEGVSGSAE
jgi:hypothetical protein